MKYLSPHVGHTLSRVSPTGGGSPPQTKKRTNPPPQKSKSPPHKIQNWWGGIPPHTWGREAPSFKKFRRCGQNIIRIMPRLKVYMVSSRFLGPPRIFRSPQNFRSPPIVKFLPGPPKNFSIFFCNF